jgi:hypothetical protein
MSSYYPPTLSNTLKFNPKNFIGSNDYITLEDADRRYMLRSESTFGSITATSITTSTLTLNGQYISGVTSVSAIGKLMYIDNNRDFGGLRFNVDNTLTASYNVNLMAVPGVSTQPILSLGKALTNGNCFQIGYTHVGDSNVLNRIYIMPQGASANDTITMTVNGGRVGIGSPTPTQKLEVAGNVNISSGSSYMIGGSTMMTNVPSASGVRIGGDTTIGCEFYTSSTLRYAGFAGVSLGANNSVWTTFNDETAFIGLGGDFITMGSAMDSDTSIRFLDEDAPTNGYKLSSTGVVSTFSDIRLKKRIQPLVWDNILDRIEKLEVCSFQFKRPETCKRATNKFKRRVKGFIAQNVQEQFPEFVSRSDDNDLLQVEIGLMYLPLFQAIKELNGSIKSLSDRLQAVEEKMANNNINQYII